LCCVRLPLLLLYCTQAVRPYVLDFTTAFDHICIHTGGRGVIDEIEKHLALNSHLIEPSRAALFR
jgi:3-ketoacyl-CoA synthase